MPPRKRKTSDNNDSPKRATRSSSRGRGSDAAGTADEKTSRPGNDEVPSSLSPSRGRSTRTKKAPSVTDTATPVQEDVVPKRSRRAASKSKSPEKAKSKSPEREGQKSPEPVKETTVVAHRKRKSSTSPKRSVSPKKVAVEKKAEDAPTVAVSTNSLEPTMEPEAQGGHVQEMSSDERNHHDAKTMDIKCPYLDTVDRHRLDFDFEKACSVSLSQINVYACLVCGKYFQGRGNSSHAYFHSMDEEHHVFMNLASKRIYCLPDNYEVKDASLSDIQYVVDPTFSKQDLEVMDVNGLTQCLDLSGKPYIPGYVGLNNIKQNDYINAVLQALFRVKSLRNRFLMETEFKSSLLRRFGLLVRKVWNRRAFKGHISPHELLQEIVNCSNKKFKITEQGDSFEFLIWFLNSMHRDLGGSRKPMSSVVHQLFQGELELESKPLVMNKGAAEDSMDMDPPTSHPSTTTRQVPFLSLSLDLPPMPLFTGELEKDLIPQVALETLLQKYTSRQPHVANNSTEERRIRVAKYPRYLILHIKRFGQNTFSVEKNVTIVNFPMQGLVLPAPAIPNGQPAMYNLVANITHEGNAKSGEGVYKVHVCNRKAGKWFLCHDLDIQEINPEILMLSEAYVQIWERVK